MIAGRIDTNLEARITLRLVHGQGTTEVEFLLDTGFNGHIAVSSPMVTRFSLPLRSVQRGLTADGRVSFYDTVQVEVLWHGLPHSVLAQVLDEPLIGTRMLAGSRLEAKWIVGGEVKVLASD